MPFSPDSPGRFGDLSQVPDNPIFPWPPSDAISKLKELVPKFNRPEPINFGNPYMPINIITALALHMDLSHNRHLYDKLTLRSGETDPIKVVSSLPIYTPDSHPDNPFLFAESVLINYAYRKTSGVVLEGPIAGVILEVEGTKKPEEGMNVRRLWRDDKISSYPTLPDAHSLALLAGDEDLIKRIGLSYRKLLEIISPDYQNDMWLSHLLMLLCHFLDISIEREKFYTTRFIEQV